MLSAISQQESVNDAYFLSIPLKFITCALGKNFISWMKALLLLVVTNPPNNTKERVHSQLQAHS